MKRRNIIKAIALTGLAINSFAHVAITQPPKRKKICGIIRNLQRFWVLNIQ